jgi:hypothetical protein
MKDSLISDDEDLSRSLYMLSARVVDLAATEGSMPTIVNRLCSEYQVGVEKVIDALLLTWLVGKLPKDYLEGI